MPLWLERYILPICATIVFGICIINPLKFDWQQRLALAVVISAFAYFIAHTVHKPKVLATGDVIADPRISGLEDQVRDLKAQQDRLKEQQAESGKEKKERQAIRDQVGKLLIAGNNLKAECDSPKERPDLSMQRQSRGTTPP